MGQCPKCAPQHPKPTPWNCLELSRICALFLAEQLAISFPSILAMSLLIIPLFVLILVHWNLYCWVCKLLESGSLFHVALIWGVIPETKSPLRGRGPHASPSIMSLHACTFSRNAPGFCCWQGVLGDACSASAICALSYQLNHGDLHGNPMRPGISVPLCI